MFMPSVVLCETAISSGSAPTKTARAARSSVNRSKRFWKPSSLMRPVSASAFAASAMASMVGVGSGPAVPVLR